MGSWTSLGRHLASSTSEKVPLPKSPKQCAALGWKEANKTPAKLMKQHSSIIAWSWG